MKAAASIAALVLAACGACVPTVGDVAVPEVVGREASQQEALTCQAGCAVAPPEPLTQRELRAHLDQVAIAPLGAASESLETLLFHRELTRQFVLENGSGLDPQRERFLTRELSRTHAVIEMRVVDEHGKVRARLAQTAVPFGQKKHLHFAEYDGIQPFETSGTSVRVGLGHIWSRY